MKIRCCADQSSRYSTKSSSPIVGAVHVLEHHHHRIKLGHALEEQAPPREQLLPSEAGLDDAEQDSEPGRHELALARVDDPALQSGTELRLGLLDGSILRDPQPMPDHLRERPVRDAVAVGQTTTRVPQEPVREVRQVIEELPAQPGLAHAGGARDRDELSRGTAHCGVAQLLDQAQLGIATDELRLEAVAVAISGAVEHLDQLATAARARTALDA